MNTQAEVKAQWIAAVGVTVEAALKVASFGSALVLQSKIDAGHVINDDDMRHFHNLQLELDGAYAIISDAWADDASREAVRSKLDLVLGARAQASKAFKAYMRSLGVELAMPEQPTQQAA